MPEHRQELPDASAAPNTRSRSLPPYRGVVAVDAKDFTGYPAIEHGTISSAIPQLLESSFERAGLGEVWSGRSFPASTGDGYVFGCDPSVLPFVIHPWLQTLQELLTEYNLHSVGAVRLRFRVSLHVGPLPDSGAESDGNGTPRNDTHRLLDSRPVKAVLASSSENITQVAAILSDRCYQDAVASGYTGKHSDHFIEVPATVEGKQFAQPAWLYVPAPSGNLNDPRILGERVAGGQAPGERSDRGTAAGRRRAPNTVNRYSADRGILTTGRVTGDQTVNNHDVDGDFIGGDHVAGDAFGGDYVGGSKAGTVHGNQGDTVHGDKNGDRRDGGRR